MQCNFCFAFGNIFYLTNWLKGSEEAIFDLESEISRNEVQKASCSANQQCLCNLERFEVREAHWKANQSRCEGAECKPRNIGGKPGGAAGPGVTPVSHRCHVSSIRSADCLYKSPATCTPQCHIEVVWHRGVRKRVGTSGFSRGHHDTTTSHGTLGILGNTYSNV